jgi:hypothetical protein
MSFKEPDKRARILRMLKRIAISGGVAVARFAIEGRAERDGIGGGCDRIGDHDPLERRNR